MGLKQTEQTALLSPHMFMGIQTLLRQDRALLIYNVSVVGKVDREKGKVYVAGVRVGGSC